MACGALYKPKYYKIYVVFLHTNPSKKWFLGGLFIKEKIECRDLGQNRQILIDVKKEKVYSGTINKIRYDRFEDTIKYMPHNKWLEFIKEARLIPDKNRTRNILIFRLLCSTGMRIGEFSKIKINQVDFENNTIEIPVEVTKKKREELLELIKN